MGCGTSAQSSGAEPRLALPQRSPLSQPKTPTTTPEPPSQPRKPVPLQITLHPIVVPKSPQPEQKLAVAKPEISEPLLPAENKRAAVQTEPKPSGEIRWQRGELIGRGAYGKVYLGLNLDTGQPIAIKTVLLTGDIKQIAADIRALKQEISLLRGLDHPNIVRYFWTDISPDKRGVDILLEYMPAGSLRTLLDRFGPMEERLVKVCLRQILEGLKYLHAKGIIHRDLKCANILVDNEGVIKLSDFGASKRISFSDSHKKRLGVEEDGTELSKSLKGSPFWMAPEVVLRVGHNKSADIWSLGCVMIELRTGHPPWSEVGQNAIQVLQAIAQTRTGPPIAVEMFSPLALAFLRRCLAVNPEERPTAEQLLEDLFIAQKDEPKAGTMMKQMSAKMKTSSPQEQSPPDRRSNAEFGGLEKSEPGRGEENSPEGKSVAVNAIQLMEGEGTVINTEFAKKMREELEREQAEKERAKQEKLSKRKQWDEELRRELAQQRLTNS